MATEHSSGDLRRAALPPLERGWTDLAGRRWAAALAGFEEALAERQTAEAQEGRSWAAWWLDDAETVFEAREQAYRLYEAAGDPVGAARMAIWLASDRLDFEGAFPSAGGWLARAHRLLDPLDAVAEHGWLAFLEGYLAHAAGRTEEAAGLARRAAAVGRSLRVPEVEMLGLALEGATLVACARIEDGMRCLDEAVASASADDLTVPIAGAWACCFLVTACTAARDHERAAEWCERIAGFADRYGSRYMLGFCRAEYGEIHVWHGRWDTGEAMLRASVEDLSRSRPAFTGGPLVALAELRRRQGRGDEASRLLEQAGADRNGQLCRARLALDDGDPLVAAELAERVLRQLSGERRLDRAPALELRVRARVATGELDEARGAVRELRELARLAATPPLRASADLAEGIVAAAAGDHHGARTLLEDAVDRFERAGGPFDAARARIELAATLAALGRDASARQEAQTALATLLELGAEVDAARARRLLGRREPAPVTSREQEVLRLLADGLTNRQIAERLTLSEHTIHRHVANILRKLDLPSRTAAAAYAVRRGLSDAARR